MLDYLVAHPEKGLLGYEMGLKTIVQYWRSFDQLEAFAKDKDDPHLDVWRTYWKRVGKSGRTGIWHETFLVRAGEYEAVYGNMPTYGLGKASKAVPVAEIRERLAQAVGAVPNYGLTRGKGLDLPCDIAMLGFTKCDIDECP